MVGVRNTGRKVFFAITHPTSYYCLVRSLVRPLRQKSERPKNFIVCDIMLRLENAGKTFLMIVLKAIVRCFIFVFNERTQENITSTQNIEFYRDIGIIYV